MAGELDKDQLIILKKAFDSFDANKTGSISTEMVGTILRLMGQSFNEKNLRDLISEVDEDASGQLEFEEFVILASKFIVEEDAESLAKELKEAFRLYDKAGKKYLDLWLGGGNGFIPTSSLREILKELDDQLSKQDLDAMIEEIDTDGSGTVDFDEFMELMTGE